MKNNQHPINDNRTRSESIFYQIGYYAPFVVAIALAGGLSAGVMYLIGASEFLIGLVAGSVVTALLSSMLGFLRRSGRI